MNIPEIATYIKHNIKGKIKVNEPLRNHTTFRIGGPADILVIPDNTKDLYKLLYIAKNHNLIWHVIGNGSNILVNDKGLRGIVIKICNSINNVELSTFVGTRSIYDKLFIRFFTRDDYGNILYKEKDVTREDVLEM